jgi:hypothetical protein
VVNACEKFGCLPHELYQADAELLRLLSIVQQGTPEEDDQYGEGPYEDEYEDYEEV